MDKKSEGRTKTGLKFGLSETKSGPKLLETGPGGPFWVPGGSRPMFEAKNGQKQVFSGL